MESVPQAPSIFMKAFYFYFLSSARGVLESDSSPCNIHTLQVFALSYRNTLQRLSGKLAADMEASYMASMQVNQSGDSIIIAECIN
jgi:hypothetical protein